MRNPTISQQQHNQPPPAAEPQSLLFLDFFFISSPVATNQKQQQQQHVEEDHHSIGDADPDPGQQDSNPNTSTITTIISESKSLFSLATPMLLTSVILYTRSLLSMLFLGRLGDSELAAGSLAIAFANITGYSVLSGLSLGMEPFCSQAFGASLPKLLSLTLHRTCLFLLTSSLPISFLWLQMPRILTSLLHQDPTIATLAHTYLLFSLPDLITNSFLHPIRIYLRAQGITSPIAWATLAGTLLHLPLNLLLVPKLELGVAGVAAASSAANLFSLLFLITYVWAKDLHKPTWASPTRDCLSGWGPLARLAGPSCISVCLEWWWYEIMIVLCGLLTHPKATVASMGVLIQTTSLIYNFPSSLGLAVSARVGNELGAGRPKKAKLSAAVAVMIASVMGVTAMVFAIGMRREWGRMYTRDNNILTLTAAALPVLGLCELGNCPQTVACGVVRGTARPTTAANVNLGAFYLVGTPVAIGLGFYFGVGFVGLWIGLLAAQLCCAGMMLYVVGTTDWDQQAKRARVLTSDSHSKMVDDGFIVIDDAEEGHKKISAGDDGKVGLKEPLIKVVVA